MKPAILLAVAAVLCAACVPFRAYDLPKVSGRVVETGSLQPISGATIKSTSLRKENLTATAFSDASGQFKLDDVHHNVWLLPLPYDPSYPDAALTISAPGYKSLETSTLKLERSPGQTDVIIRLDRERS